MVDVTRTHLYYIYILIDRVMLLICHFMIELMSSRVNCDSNQSATMLYASMHYHIMCRLTKISINFAVPAQYIILYFCGFIFGCISKNAELVYFGSISVPSCMQYSQRVLRHLFSFRRYINETDINVGFLKAKKNHLFGDLSSLKPYAIVCYKKETLFSLLVHSFERVCRCILQYQAVSCTIKDEKPQNP